MNEFLDKLLKLRSEYFRRRKFLFILDMISIFSIFYAVFIILQVEYFLNRSSLYIPLPVKFMPPIIAFIITLIGALLLHRNDSKINVIHLIEKKYPDLSEKLSTAYDNRDESNVIVESLKELVLGGLNLVSTSRLFPAGLLIAKILVAIIFISATTIIYTHPDTYSIPPGILINLSQNLTGTGAQAPGDLQVTGRPENSDKVGAQGSGDIFGKPKIASIEGKNIDLTLYSGIGTGYDVRDASQVENTFIKSAAFPVDVLGSNVSDGGYSLLMTKTEAEKQLINKYAVERSKI